MGWFVDSSPQDDSEFAITLRNGTLLARPESDAFGQIDLLSVVAHELGHVLGLSHDDDAMAPALKAGERVMPNLAPVASPSLLIQERAATWHADTSAAVPQIDWAGSVREAETSPQQNASKSAGWAASFVNNLARNDTARESNAKIRVVVPEIAAKLASEAARRVGSLFR
jgi:hypothetical protein